ncbi:hypothetical protein HY415_02890 [Candidatus Kaiserbacteria bacterium]|nr:hypothetical protein [Candidatus Kaiserbacteria bacterium]
MRNIFAVAATAFAFGLAGVAFAQTAPPEGATDTQINSALEDLSAVYGTPVVRLDQAKAICNEERYIVDCAEIGKKHDLFSGDRTKQVTALLTELKGKTIEKLKQCEDVACLVDVATSIAGRLSSSNLSVARAVGLTPQKVEEKRAIVDTAKSLGVDLEACRTMDPDTASIELLRGCARLAKHENVQKYVPQATKDRANETDGAIALRESLASGQISCGDNTLEGCGNFCLAPSAEARAGGAANIPDVCRQIAAKFFGDGGVKELEHAYTTVQKTFDTLTNDARNTVFTTADGQTLSDPGSIGRYMEGAGNRGDVEAVSRGMDFLIAKGFVTPKDRDFALSVVQKVRERGPVDFSACRADPSLCADLISEEEKGQFNVMGEIEKIMRNEMINRGVADPSRCSSDPSAGQSCLEAARAALPQIERFAGESPQAQRIVSDIRQKIRFGEAGLEARSRVEERFKTTGDFSMGDRRFASVNELETFCKANSQQCLSETARDGIFSRDVAEEKYARVIENRYDALPPERVQGTPFVQDGFNKEEALQQFKQWLDNPQGPPPMPPGVNARPYPQYSPYPQYPTPYPPYQQLSTDPQRCQYAAAPPTPCRIGEYRQESTNEFGCRVFGSCIPLATKTEPPRTDRLNICPALPTVESCPAGEERAITFSSPECGTYYSCQPAYKPPVPDDQNRIVPSCERYGSGWRSLDSSGNCFSPSMSEYRTVNGALYSCSAFPAYGCSASDVPPSPLPPPSGQREQVWNSAGLRSWIRSDASASRIESLKSACANVSSRANVWLPGAGTQSSPDFGMPDPAKCAVAASCTSEQYFDGTSCKAQGTSQACSAGQYWDGTSCTSNTVSGMQKCFYPNASKNGAPTGYTVWCEKDYYNCHEGSPSGVAVGLTGLSLGAPSTCEVGWTGSTGSCPSGQYWNGTSCVTSTTTTCPSNQYWNGASCVSNTTTVTGSCSSELTSLLGSGCHSMGGGWFNGEMSKYVLSNSQTVRSCTTEPVSGCTGTTQAQTSCPSGQYWNGSSCVTSTTQTSCSSGQYWNGTSCVTSTTQTSCSSGQYWNGSSCVTSTTQTSCPSGQYWNGSTCQTTNTYDTASAQQGCTNAGGTWESSSNYCRMPTTCPSGQYWNGSACQTTSTSDTTSTYNNTSAQQSCASAGGTWDSAANYCRMPTQSTSCSSGEYWNGSSCVSSTQTTTGTYTPPPDTSTYTPPPDTSTYTAPSSGTYTPPPSTTESAPISYLFCPDGHDWNGAYCTLSPRTPFERYMANVLSALGSLVGL